MTPTPTPNITRLAQRAEVSRRQVRRDLENGAPSDVRGYLAWRRGRAERPEASLEYALSRGADLWGAYDHQRSRYVERAQLADLRTAIMERLRAAYADFPENYAPLLCSSMDAPTAHRMIGDAVRDAIYFAMQTAYLQIAARRPDDPQPLRRPADGTLAKVRAWVREGQSARVRMRSDIRDQLLVPVAELEDELRSAANDAKQTLIGVAGRIPAFVDEGKGRSVDEMKRHIRESLDFALREADEHLQQPETRKRR